MPRDILERIVALDERFRPRRHLDRARLARVVSRPVKVVVRRQELRQNLGLFDFGERVEEDRQLVVVSVAWLGKQFLRKTGGSDRQLVRSRVSGRTVFAHIP